MSPRSISLPDPVFEPQPTPRLPTRQPNLHGNSYGNTLRPDAHHTTRLPRGAFGDGESELRGGIHIGLFAPDTVTFILYAPYKPYVSLVGEFNEWDTRSHPLLSDGQGTWWITLADPGPTRYGYYVAIDDQAHVWVADPYAHEVRWQSENEVWAWWPGAAQAVCSNPQPRKSGRPTPPLRDLVIYELCVRDFGGEWRGNRPHLGRFGDLLPRLDYLEKLGINAIELMPIQAFPGQSSWGYNPVFYFAPAEVYGSSQDFKRLVDACHERGVAVILDVAFNHAWGQHPYYQMYPPLYSPNGTQLQDWNPFFHHTPAAVNMWGGVDWDHFVPVTTRYFQDVVRFWLLEYGVDGFRFDWVCGVDYDSWNPMRADFNPYHGINAICWAARSVKPDCVLIGEFWQLAGTSMEKTSARLVNTTEMDAIWSGDFHHVLEDVLNERWQWEKQDIFRALGGFREQGFSSATQTVNFSCSHDEVRPEHEVKFYSWRNIRAPQGMGRHEAALRKGLLGLLAVLTAPGVPMIYAGQEFGEDTPRTIDFLPLTWSKLEHEAHRAHMEVVTRLIRLRRENDALRSDHIEFLANDFASEKLVRFRRWGENGQVVYVALNFEGTSRRVNLPFIEVNHGEGGSIESGIEPAVALKTGGWRDFVSNRRVAVEETDDGRQFDVLLGPWEGAVIGFDESL